MLVIIHYLRKMADYMIEKYKFLTSIGDENKINKLLSDDISLDLVASFNYSDEEKEELESVYTQTKNKKIGQLLKMLT